MTDERKTNEPVAAATGAHTTAGTPHGYSTLTPFLALADPTGAMDFYQRVFGARVVNCSEMDGRIVHAELALDNGRLQLGAAQQEYQLSAIDPADTNVQFSLGIYLPNVDAVVQRAIDAGATLREPVMSFVSGDRFGLVRDPFGVRWSVMTRVEDLSDGGSAKKVTDWLAAQPAG